VVTVAARPGLTEQLEDAAAEAGVTLVDTANWVGVDEWFELHGCQVAVIRPDRYVYGTSSSAADARRMISDLSTLYPAAARG
jgi:hypothetical protein